MVITLIGEEQSPIELVTTRTFLVRSMEHVNVNCQCLNDPNFSDNLTGQSSRVKQYQYTGWPDFGAPENTVPILQLCREVAKSGPRRLLVHCSAGVGRTGTYLALLKIIDEIETGQEFIDIYNTVLELRSHRVQMVNIMTLEYLRLVYLNIFLIGPKVGAVHLLVQCCEILHNFKNCKSKSAQK